MNSVDVEEKELIGMGGGIGLVLIDGGSLNEAILRNGYAWVYWHKDGGR